MTSAMLAAKQGRAEQLKVLDAYMAGEKVAFKSHQGQNRDFETEYDPTSTARERDPTKLQFRPETMFLDAAANVDAEEVGSMLAAGAVNPNTVNADGLTALHQACIESSLKVVSVLLQNGADVNAADNDWWTPLHAAAACDHWRIVSVLLQNGADVSMVNADGDLAVDLAEDGKTKQGLEAEMARSGLEGDAIDKAKSWANIEAQFIEKIKPLIEAGTQSDYRGAQGESLLHIAASNGWVDAAKLLIEAKVPITPTDEDGDTPLHLAAFFEQYKMVELLGEAGAKVTAVNRYRDSVLLMTEDATMTRLLKAIQSNQKQKLASGAAGVMRGKRSGSSVKRKSMADKQFSKKKDATEEMGAATQYAELQFGKDGGDDDIIKSNDLTSPTKYTEVNSTNSSKRSSKENVVYDQGKSPPKQAMPAAPDLYAVPKGKRNSTATGEPAEDDGDAKKKDGGGGCCVIS